MDDIDRFDVTYWMYQIPFRLKYTYSLNNRFLFKPFIGFIYGIDDSIDDGLAWVVSPFLDGKDYVLTLLDRDNFEDYFFMAHLGIDTEFRIGKHHSFVLNIEYSKGFKKLVSRALDYYYNYSDGRHEHYYSEIIGKGDFLAFGISYKYNFIAKPIKKVKTEEIMHQKKRRIK